MCDDSTWMLIERVKGKLAQWERWQGRLWEIRKEAIRDGTASIENSLLTNMAHYVREVGTLIPLATLVVEGRRSGPLYRRVAMVVYWVGRCDWLESPSVYVGLTDPGLLRETAATELVRLRENVQRLCAELKRGERGPGGPVGSGSAGEAVVAQETDGDEAT